MALNNKACGPRLRGCAIISGKTNGFTIGLSVARGTARAKSSKNSKANRIETGERSGGIGEICSVEVDEK